MNKSTGPYSIPSKVLNMVKNEISEQLADVFKALSQLIQKLHSETYHPMSLLSSLDKILEKPIHSRLSNFFKY